MSRTALHHAVEKGHTEVCKLLINAGIEVNHADQVSLQ